jgi:metacaspase-1
MASKRALLIGINRYQIPGADLRGCVNDVDGMRSALVDLCGFQAGDIETLKDGDATKKAMQARIKSLVKDGRKGDVLLLHYSGHGSNVPDDNGDEADHRDEILCPTDLDWKDPFRDDWLRRTFDGLRAGVSLTVVMDCCHSGTNTRAIHPPDAPVIPRYLPNPWDIMAAESGRKLKGKVRGRLRRTPPRKSGPDIVAVTMPETLIAGCRDTQTSADAFIDGSYNGALTWSLVSALRATTGKLSYRELHARAVALLSKGRYDQVPQLEGRKPRLEAAFLSAEA